VAQRLRADEYLAWEATQSERHEFIAGTVIRLEKVGPAFVETSASEAHVTAALSLAIALRQHLAGTPCRTFITDMKLHVQAADAYFYPDVTVTCGAADAASPNIKREPMLLAKVLSPGTAAYDRGDKFAAYRRIATLREYLLVDPDTRRADLYRLGPDGLWVLHPDEPDTNAQLDSVKLLLTPAALWAEMPPADGR
jgi:Uma2 family endonuclease